MNRNNLTDRRRFVRGAGAALVAPLAMGSAAAAGREAGPGGTELQAHVQHLEAVAEVRLLHLAYFERINAGLHERVVELFADPEAVPRDGVRHLSPGLAELDEAIALSADGAEAQVRVSCIAEVATAIESDCTAAQMARLQGGGVITRSEARVLESTCVRQSGAWKFVALATRTVGPEA